MDGPTASAQTFSTFGEHHVLHDPTFCIAEAEMALDFSEACDVQVTVSQKKHQKQVALMHGPMAHLFLDHHFPRRCSVQTSHSQMGLKKQTMVQGKHVVASFHV